MVSLTAARRKTDEERVQERIARQAWQVGGSSSCCYVIFALFYFFNFWRDLGVIYLRADGQVVYLYGIPVDPNGLRS